MKTLLLLITIVCISLSSANADKIINGFTFVENTAPIEVLPDELPATGVEEWNGDCSSYGINSYWKDGACYTPKGLWYFEKQTNTSSKTLLTCVMTTDGSIDNLINRLTELRKEYLNNDYLCKDIVGIEKELHMLVDSIWMGRDKTITTSTNKETPKRLAFPAPTVKYITKTVTVKVCNMGVYDKTLDTCILMITGAR